MKKQFMTYALTILLCLSLVLCGGCSDYAETEETIVVTRVVTKTGNTKTTTGGLDGSSSATTTTSALEDASSSTDTANNQKATTSTVKNNTTKTSTTETTTTLKTTKTTATTAVSRPSDSVMVGDLNGLNVLAIGDSLFRGTPNNGVSSEKVWINRMAQQCNWNITNLGIGGMTVSLTAANTTNNKQSMYEKLFSTNDFVYGTNNSTYYKYGDTKKSASEVDVIFFLGGCNDYNENNNVPLGTVYSRDKGTFLGAWNLITEKLLEDYPNAVIVFLTTWELNLGKRADGLTSIEYSTSVKTLYTTHYANSKRVTLIDMGNPDVSGARMNDASWRKDNANDRYHLNVNGMQIVQANMLGPIWSALKDMAVI